MGVACNLHTKEDNVASYTGFESSTLKKRDHPVRTWVDIKVDI